VTAEEFKDLKLKGWNGSICNPTFTAPVESCNPPTPLSECQYNDKEEWNTPI
jgi:hypothetical protein